MRRRFRNPAPVPSGVGSGPAAVDPLPSPVSREEEEKSAMIWRFVGTYEYPIGDPRNEVGWEVTPATDPTAAPMVKKRGRPKGSKNKVQS